MVSALSRVGSFADLESFIEDLNEEQDVETYVRALAQAKVDARKFRHTEALAHVDNPRDALSIAAYLGIHLDVWQRRALTTEAPDTLLLVTRQGGKGEVAVLSALEMLNKDDSTTVVTARSTRQAKRMLRRIKTYFGKIEGAPQIVRSNDDSLELENGAEVLAVPGTEETIRGIEAVDKLIIDEAALVKKSLFDGTYPMLATTNGSCLAMSSARGKRGWFYDAWVGGDVDWHREKVTYKEISRFTPEFIARVRRRIGEFMFQQEYNCEFMDDVSQMFETELVMAALSSSVKSLGLKTLGGYVAESAE